MSREDGRSGGGTKMGKLPLMKALFLVVIGTMALAFFGYDFAWQAANPLPAAIRLIDETQDFEMIFDVFFASLGALGLASGLWDMTAGRLHDANGQ